MPDVTFVFLAGVGDSEPDHWQRLWYEAIRCGTPSSESWGLRGSKAPDALWIEHDDWCTISCSRWRAELDEQIAPFRRNKVLVAHSLGCLLAAEWLGADGRVGKPAERENPGADPARAPVLEAAARNHAFPIAAFLVAPPDVEDVHFPKQVSGFSRHSRRLSCPSTLVASRNDPFARFERCVELARAWGSTLADVGSLGHINRESGLSDWQEGKRLLRGLLERHAAPPGQA